MAEEFLDQPQIRAVGKQMCGKRVAQDMGCNFQMGRCLSAVAVKEFANAPVGKTLAVAVHE